MDTRFQGGSVEHFHKLKEAADAYPRSLSEAEQLGFWQKPFDWDAGHPNFFNNIFQILNGIQALNLAPGSTVVEVGSGAGWATEILVCLGYRVICLEPAEVMLETARKRVHASLELRRMAELSANVSYHCATLEEADFISPSMADAMIFFESFHHIIDEDKALEQAYRVLKPDGTLCILGDSNWIPGLKEQEDFWMEEMARFGTLESPFTHEYLAHVLKKHGFERIKRHHSVNGLIPIEDDARPVSEFTGNLDARYVNLFTARRSGTRIDGGVEPADLQPQPSSRMLASGIALADAVPVLRPFLQAIWRRFIRPGRKRQ